MTAYLTRSTYQALTVAPPEYVDFVEAAHPGWIDARLTKLSGFLNARLAKRYATPFAASTPDIILLWLVRLMDPVLYLKRGVDPTDAQYAEVLADAQRAREEIQEAADAKDGLFELPLREESQGATGVTKAAPQFFAEASPYAWTDAQADQASDEGSLR